MRVPENAAPGPAILRVTLVSGTGKTAGPTDLPLRLESPPEPEEPAAR